MRTVIEMASLVRRGEMKATEALDETLAAIDRHNPELNSFVHVDGDLARSSAQRIDERVARGEDPGPLAGVPFGVKDLDDCEGMPTSQGSLWFKGGPPVAADAIHVARFRAAGAVPVGKTAVPEFGTWAYTATRSATQVFGGYGFIDETPVSRFYRDAKILEIGEGTSEVQRLVISRELGLPVS